MKQALLYLTILLCLSCREGKMIEPKPDPLKTALQAHTWVQDSFVYKNVDLETYVFQEPKEFIRFGDDKYYSNGGSDSLHYALEAPDFLYYWHEEEMKTVGQFFYIESLTDSSLVLRNASTYNTYVYYHGE